MDHNLPIFLHSWGSMDHCFRAIIYCFDAFRLKFTKVSRFIIAIANFKNFVYYN